MVLQCVLLVALLVCSGIVSGSETALFALTRLEMRDFADSGRLKRQAWRLMQQPRRVLMTVLISNTAVNVLFFAISFVTFERLGEDHAVAATLGGVGALLAVILFGEILPKAVARAHAARLAPLVAPLIQAMQTALSPLRLILRLALVEPLVRLLAVQTPAGGRETGHDEVTVEELQALVELAARQGVIDTAENMMLQEIVALPQISVRSVMRPRVDVIALPLDADPAQARDRMRQARLTKLPVYGRDLDDIRGLVYARDLYLGDDTPLAKLIRPVNYLPEQCNLLQVIEHFQATRSQLAIAVDEYGGMAGLVTLEDVLEQIVGDLPGTQKPAEPAVEVISPNVYRLAGDLNVRDWAQRFGMTQLTGTKVQTVAGLILARLGRLPKEGESVRFANLTLTVERLSGRRIDRILLTHNAASSADPTTGRSEQKVLPDASPQIEEKS